MAREKMTEQLVLFGGVLCGVQDILTERMKEGFRVVSMAGNGTYGFAFLLERPKRKIKCQPKPQSKP